MREEIMQILATALGSNLGNKLTPELATGIATIVHQQWLELEKPKTDSAAPSQPA